jgi:hypothetical protein
MTPDEKLEKLRQGVHKKLDNLGKKIPSKKGGK